MNYRLISACAAFGLLMPMCGGAIGAEKVLQGVPNYFDTQTLPASTTSPSTTVPASRTIKTLTAGAAKPMLKSNPDSGVPQYVWWYGCSPTSAGMLVGYWDGLPGYQDLYYGDASVWNGNGNSGTRRMVASTAHITSGQQNGCTYGDWHNSASYPNHAANPDCLADFIQTVDSGSYSAEIATGLKNYIQWTDVRANPLKRGYQATTADIDVAYWGGNFTYANLQSQINLNRPVLLNIITYAPTLSDWVGHSVIAYGYRDNMFQVKVPFGDGSEVNMTVPGFAVQDTWGNGGGQSDWFDWNYNIVYPRFEGSVEWWPYIPLQGACYDDRWDWVVSDAVTLAVVVPEPGTLLLLISAGATALAGALLRRRAGKVISER